MIAPANTLPPVTKRPSRELIAQIRDEYLQGDSIWVLSNRYYGKISRNEIRYHLSDCIRPKGIIKEELSEEEVAQRRDEIKAKWTEEVASKRWVGRYLSKPEELGAVFSQTLRSFGGDA